MATGAGHDLAVFIDFENIALGLRDSPDKTINIQKVTSETPGQRLQAAQEQIGELGTLLSDLLPDIDDYEEIRRESWPKEIEAGELELDSAKRIRDSLEALSKAGLWSDGV